MSKPLRLALHGLDRLSDRLRQEIICIIRREFEPLVKEAGRMLRLTTGATRGDLNLDFNSDDEPGPACGTTILGEDGTGWIGVRAHRELRVCGAPDPGTGKQDRRRFLTTDWLLGRALANSGLHELGHFVADLDHSTDLNNYMFTGGLPRSRRNIRSQRETWAGQKTFTAGQRRRLVAQLGTGEWLGDMIVQ